MTSYKQKKKKKKKNYAALAIPNIVSTMHVNLVNMMFL